MQRSHSQPNAKDAVNDRQVRYYLLSTNTKWIPAYPSTKKAAQNTAKPTASFHNSNTWKPKELRIVAPGTSISRPYFLSSRLKYRTSLTMSPSKAKWKMES